MKHRTKGESYRPIVHILKVKNGLPTVIKVSGQKYMLVHKDQYRRGHKKEVAE